MRGIALICAAGPLAVAPQEGILRLRAGAIEPALRMAAEASEGVGPPGRPSMDATEPRRVVDGLPVGPPAAPAVLGAEQVSEQLVAHDEEGIDPEDATVQGLLGERGVLDQLARVARIEHPVEVLAATEIDGLLELLQQDGVVGYRGVVRGEAGVPCRRAVSGMLRVRLDQPAPERHRREQAGSRGAPWPSASRPRAVVRDVRHGRAISN